MNMVGFIVGLAAFVAAWGTAIAIVAVAVLLSCLVGVISPPTAAIMLAAVTVAMAVVAAFRRQWVGVIFWLLTLGSGSAAAAFGPGPLAVWGLVVGVITLGILFGVPAVFSPAARNVLRVLLAIQLLLSLALMAREVGWNPGGWAALAALLLLGLSALLGAGSYRPREVRRVQRLASRWVMVAAIALLLWQPVIAPTGRWLVTTGREVNRALTGSPLGSWYRATSARAQRAEIGEAAKTAAIRDLREDLQRSHQERWRKGINQIPSLPLSPGEWGDLGIPRESDP